MVSKFWRDNVCDTLPTLSEPIRVLQSWFHSQYPDLYRREKLSNVGGIKKNLGGGEHVPSELGTIGNSSTTEINGVVLIVRATQI